ncbi:MAG: DUF342 domain-containing protein [Gammaproteobacteria bacterium]|nr:DUF342 domain-containing protein [Gammaproteobacteria bacterium]
MLIVDGDRLYFVDTLTSSSNTLYLSDILSTLKDSEFAHVEFDANLIEAELKRLNTQLHELADQQKDKSADSSKIKVKLAIGKFNDANIEVIPDKDGMSATAAVTLAKGGKPITEEDIKKACLRAKIRFGLKASLVKGLLEKLQQAKPDSTVEHVIVTGKPPVNGNDAYIKPLVDLFSQSMRQHKRYDDGRFDMRDFGEIHTVDVGQVVAEKVSATEGIAGSTIFGEQIPATPGEDIALVPTEGVEINPDNENQLIATKKGLMRMEDGSVVVDDILVLDTVDAKTGHVKFKGSVIVKGDVTPDMNIEATGDVTIAGFVESATVRCSGHLMISGGCSGRILNEEELENDYAKARNARYSCSLYSDLDITVAFTNQCQLIAKKHIQVEKHLIHSHLTASSVCVGSGDRPSGKILGSYFYLSRSLEAGFIGSESNVHVDIDMNRGYQNFAKKLLELRNVVNKIKKKKQQIQQKIEDEQATPVEPNLIKKQMAVIEQQLAKYQQMIKALEIKRKKYLGSLYVKANSKLLSHVKFQFSEHALITHEQKSASIIKLVDEEIVIEPN